MSFDTPTLIWCIAVPALIALLGSLTSRWIAKRSQSETTLPAELTLSASLWFAIAVAVYGREHLTSERFPLWSDDAWATVIWPLFVGIMLVSPRATSRICASGTLWILMAIVAVIGAAVVMPTGDGWADVLPLHRPWIAGVATSTILNTYLLHVIAGRGMVNGQEAGAGRWLPLILLAGFACAAIIGASAYGALFEICLAAIASASVIALFAGLGWLTTSPAIIFISTLFSASMIAAGRFYSYAEVPAWAYLLALFAPSIIAVPDFFVWRRSAWVRVSIAAVVAMAVVSTVAYSFLVA
jgi:hypothetical protein